MKFIVGKYGSDWTLQSGAPVIHLDQYGHPDWWTPQLSDLPDPAEALRAIEWLRGKPFANRLSKGSRQKREALLARAERLEQLV